MGAKKGIYLFSSNPYYLLVVVMMMPAIGCPRWDSQLTELLVVRLSAPVVRPALPSRGTVQYIFLV